MELRILQLNEDKTNKLFDSENCQTLLNMYEEFYPKIGFNLPWVAYLIIRENQVVGSCSFVGQPKEGKVEIAYWTFKEYEGQGISSFACKELVAISQGADPNLTITAKTAPEHNASTRILQKTGVVFTEIVQDEEIGGAWVWTFKAKATKD